jgi:SAM-dependent methyltransferase
MVVDSAETGLERRLQPHSRARCHAAAIHPTIREGCLVTDHLSLFRALVDDPEGGRLGGLVEGYLPAVLTGAVARLDVADHLGDEARDVGNLAAAIGAEPDALRRLLAAASVYGLVVEEPGARFRLTGLGAGLHREGPHSLRDLAVSFSWRFAPLWEGIDRLVEAVRTGGPAAANAPERTMGRFRSEAADAAGFARALARVTGVLVSQLDAAGYVPPATERIVDVGGGTGTLLAGMLRRAPTVKGVLFDRHQVLEAAPAVLAAAGVEDVVEVVAGDFFDEVPPGDLHVLCQVVHDWDDDHVGRIVANCHRASPPGGALAVIEHVLPSAPEPSLAQVMDLMMLMAGSGRERTREQHEALVAPAGYRFVRDVPLPGAMPWRVLEFRRS